MNEKSPLRGERITNRSRLLHMTSITYLCIAHVKIQWKIWIINFFILLYKIRLLFVIKVKIISWDIYFLDLIWALLFLFFIDVFFVK
jgi:hypothetical protein